MCIGAWCIGKITGWKKKTLLNLYEGMYRWTWFIGEIIVWKNPTFYNLYQGMCTWIIVEKPVWIKHIANFVTLFMGL